MKFCYPINRYVTGVAPSSSQTVSTDYPLANLEDGLPTEITRWTTAAETRLVWNWGNASPVEGLMVVMHNFSPGSVLKVQAHTADSWTSPTYSLDVTVPTAHEGDALCRNIMVDLTGTAMDGTGFQYVSLLIPVMGSIVPAIGELVWVQKWTVVTSPSWPMRRSDIRRVTINSTSYGVDHIVDRHVRQRRLWPRFPLVSNTVRNAWFALIREAGGDTEWPLMLEAYETTDNAVEGLYVRFHPDFANDFQESFAFANSTDLELDLLEVQRGIRL